MATPTSWDPVREFYRCQYRAVSFASCGRGRTEGEEGGKAYRSLHLHGKLMAGFDGVAGLGQSDPGVLRKGAGS